jgi:hypothetical protein
VISVTRSNKCVEHSLPYCNAKQSKGEERRGEMRDQRRGKERGGGDEWASRPY